MWQVYFSSFLMKTYKNALSGAGDYENGTDYIIIRFGNRYYLYTNKYTGEINVKQMKALAVIGEGLNTFISQNIKKHYEAVFNNEKDLRDYLRQKN